MAIFIDNEQVDELNISGTYSAGNQTLTTVQMYNNNDIVVKIGNLVVSPSATNLQNADSVKLMKVVIDWGDGSNPSVTSPISISGNNSNWNTLTHRYNLINKTSVTMTIKAYNTISDCVTLTQPINFLYTSLLQNGVNFRLISANLTNQNTVSYVLTDINSKTTITAHSLQAPVGSYQDGSATKPTIEPEKEKITKNYIDLTFENVLASDIISLVDWFHNANQSSGKIDWGDGSNVVSFDGSTNGNAFYHSYKNPGTYRIKVTGNNLIFRGICGGIIAIREDADHWKHELQVFSYNVTTCDCLASVNVIGISPITSIVSTPWTELQNSQTNKYTQLQAIGAFAFCSNLRTIAFDKLFNNPAFQVNEETYLTGFCYDCKKLTSQVPNWWDVYSISKHNKAFFNCDKIGNYNQIPEDWK